MMLCINVLLILNKKISYYDYDYDDNQTYVFL